MATRGGQITLHGRFPKGTDVRLVRVRDERALRAEGGDEVATGTVDDDGRVQFKRGVEVDARYFIVGYVDGQPLEVRARGRSADDDSEVLSQPPVRPDRTRLADGSWSDEPPKSEKVPGAEVGPALGQHQVPAGTPQRSDTLRGTAHPVDPSEPTPYPRQEDVADGTPQMSSTATGRATPIIASTPSRQEDVPAGTPQRSDTVTGVATPIPSGDALEAQRVKESSLAKAARGEPARAAAEPLEAATVVKGAAKRAEPTNATTTAAAPGPEDTSGRDAQGQPLDEGVAAASGLRSADKPAEPVKTPRAKSQKNK